MTRVLVIDDEPQILRALRINLSVRGYEVTTADTGAKALRVALSLYMKAGCCSVECGLGGHRLCGRPGLLPSVCAKWRPTDAVRGAVECGGSNSAGERGGTPHGRTTVNKRAARREHA